ncbi:hypothetical protein BRADI_2g50962v3 [Brachypodium distachyon]|uniref:Uncharacterized protein n=1 Tax=Brachypodium distachyon TaxID=15368 RepID=A0A2K2DF67_BRADI|nr:hypothetical protein BRADI_2g50962v3 [Brachypodium distachyon]
MPASQSQHWMDSLGHTQTRREKTLGQRNTRQAWHMEEDKDIRSSLMPQNVLIDATVFFIYCAKHMSSLKWLDKNIGDHACLFFPFLLRSVGTDTKEC